MLKLRVIILLATLGLISFTLALGFRFMKPPKVAAPILAPASSKPTAPLDEKGFLHRFEQQIWPLLTRGGENSCVACHDADNNSELHFFTDAESSFKMLLERGYFVTNSPDTLLARITTTNHKKRMPKGKDARLWNANEIQTLHSFLSELQGHLALAGTADEQFPNSLLTRYQGPVPDGLDNQFISYRQLRGKIATIFQDDWQRNERDLFADNVAMFSGADFKERFNESTKASATFLTALEMLSRDVAARAYTQKTGPFADRSEYLPSPLALAKPDAACQKGIRRLYETILFRAPTSEELQSSFQFLQQVHHGEKEMKHSDFDLAFKLIVEDEATGLAAARTVTISVSADAHGLYQELIDQSGPPPEEDKTEDETTKRRNPRKVSAKVARHKLALAFLFQPGDAGQFVKISNANTVGNVSFHSLEIHPADNPDTNSVQRIAATNVMVQAEGGWKLEERRGLTSFEDENNDKGNASVTIPISVVAKGRYEITVCWRENADNAPNVLTEVFSHDTSQLAQPPRPPVPPSGEAHYFIDQTIDTIAFADLNAVFQFGPDDYVEINNAGTRNRVTADAVKFVDAKSRKSFLIDNDEAEGKENWQEYKGIAFEAYNKTGRNTYHDDNAKKGELWLRYKPSSRTNTWNAETFYNVHVGYPAKRDHEIRAPVIVKAQRSSPIIQLAYPARARVEADLELDAAATYTVHGSKLKFTWQQIDGPVVKVNDWHAPVLRFQVARENIQQIAWVGLCQALMRHPDFLFTRPPSLERTKDRREKQRLQLVKIALDLVGRPPNQAELEKFAGGARLDRMIDDYLQTQEFKDFYFHRIRLYVESHGTETQDEPARLWCYVAFNNRPFQELLTADYTVDAKFQKQPRPAHFGRTGVLTTRGFMEGKPGLPHFNYAAQVAELFLGYIFEVPPEVVAQREGITATGTTDPNSLCYSCHKVLTPLAFQRTRWDDEGRYRTHDDYGLPIDDSDQMLVASYPFKGDGLEAFATQAVKKERFVRTIINTHFTFYFGRDLRFQDDERGFYKRLWEHVHKNNFAIRSLIKAMLTAPEYLEGQPRPRSKDQLGKPDPKNPTKAAKLRAGLKPMKGP